MIPDTDRQNDEILECIEKVVTKWSPPVIRVLCTSRLTSHTYRQGSFMMILPLARIFRLSILKEYYEVQF